jgi:deoxyribonuclease-1
LRRRPLSIALISLSLGGLISFQPKSVYSPSIINVERTSAAGVAESYREAKRWLFEIVHADRRTTLYCGCRFDRSKRIDPRTCGYTAIRDPERAGRAEAEHVIPASWIGEGRACWTEKICRDALGRAFGGRDCCEMIDPAYRRAAFDLQNLWPAQGDVNARRSNYRFGELPGEQRALGACDLEIDPRHRMIEPRPEVRGDIARIGRYMEQVHGIRLSHHHQRLFEAWDRADPPDAAERGRNARIRALQGHGNPFIDRHDARARAGSADGVVGPLEVRGQAP